MNLVRKNEKNTKHQLGGSLAKKTSGTGLFIFCRTQHAMPNYWSLKYAGVK